MCAAWSSRKAFVLLERLGEETLEVYSCGNGRFIPGTPSADIEIYFRVYKSESSLNIQIHENNLLQWLRAVLLPHDSFDTVLSNASISMDALLPRYPEMSAKYNQDKREGHSFDALDLFVCHFIREGSIFACFGFERLYEEQILTELHFHDIHSQNRSISEDLDLLDEAIDELGKEDIQSSSHLFPFINEPFLSQLRAAITQRDLTVVRNVLAMSPGSVDAQTLCLAIRYYERAIFHLLLERGAQVDGDSFTAGPVYHAAKAGHMEAVQLLLNHGANKEGGSSYVSATPMSGAASGGHLGIIQYLFEEKGANINGDGYKSPLSRAIMHRHTYIVDYLLRAGVNVFEEDYLELLSQFVENKDIVYGDILARSIADMSNEARELLSSRAISEGHFEISRYLSEVGTTDYQARWCRDFKLVGESVDNSWSFEDAGNFIGSRWPDYCDLDSSLLEGGESVNFELTNFELDNKFIGSDFSWENIKLGGEFNESLLGFGDFENFGGFKGSKNPEDPKDSKDAPGSKIPPDSKNPSDFRSPQGLKTPRGFKNSHDFKNPHDFENPYGRKGPGGIKNPGVVKSSRVFEAVDVENCPTVAAIQAQIRRTMTRRLIARVASSCEKLLYAGTQKSASAGLIEFVGHAGTSLSVWKSGTRAIRDICEGYMPRSLSDVVNALQVADAMRSAVPTSYPSSRFRRFRCSKQE
ncbi:hypothetical protein MKX08_004559 [Trichoderma sp. CBMAI-0020]|nr:hypothetical protein MKX08_004559 [Trichoderma sp. CBMAI-0020]